MRVIAIITALLAGAIAAAQSKPDEGIRKILDDEITTWNQGDTDDIPSTSLRMGRSRTSWECFLPDGRHSVTGTKSFSRDRSAALRYNLKSYRYGSSRRTLRSARR